jgi:holo-[acyl-carrier protein] synthase
VPAIAHGIDVVDIERFTKLVEKGGQAFLSRCFTEAEIAKATDHNTQQRLAGWFAIKESVLKAIGTGHSEGATFTDIEVSHKESGAPVIALTGRTKEFADNLGIVSWLVSISHNDKIATASVIGISSSSKN